MVTAKFQTLVTETSLPKFAANLVEMPSFHNNKSKIFQKCFIKCCLSNLLASFNNVAIICKDATVEFP